MKKFVFVIILCICFSACAGSKPNSDITAEKTTEEHTVSSTAATTSPTIKLVLDYFTDNQFSEYLTDANFVAGLSQSNMISLMDTYSYNGQKITDIDSGLHYDGKNGGGLAARGDLFGFVNDYTLVDDKTHAKYTNRFYTKVPLDGLELPYHISFEDTLATVLQKLGIDIDLQSGFLSDQENTGTMTLHNDGFASLQLTNYKLLPEKTGKEQYDYQLKYIETYQENRKSGRESTVTRSVFFSFTDDGKLGLFEISVFETYPVNLSS